MSAGKESAKCSYDRMMGFLFAHPLGGNRNVVNNFEVKVKAIQSAASWKTVAFFQLLSSSNGFPPSWLRVRAVRVVLGCGWCHNFLPHWLSWAVLSICVCFGIWQLPVRIVEIDNFCPTVDCFNLYFIFLCVWRFCFSFLFGCEIPLVRAQNAKS